MIATLVAHVVAATSGTGCQIPTNGALPASGICTDRASIHIPISYRSIGPILILFVGALLLLVVSSLIRQRSRPGLWAPLTAAIGVVSGVVSVLQWFDVGNHPSLTIAQQVAYDHFSVLFMLLISVATVLGALSTDSYLRREGLDNVVPYVLLAGAGAMLMAASAGLIMVFLGLEIMSISLYVMAAYHRRRQESGEAGLKYFILGAFSSAIFLYGVALIYGATGSTQFVEIAQFLATSTLTNDGVLLAGMVLVIVGLGFKVAAVPFHFWTPDVYQGSPTPFTGYMAAVAKAAGFAALVRVLVQALSSQQANWRPVIWFIAVLTLIVGSVLAIAQRDVKRMLAYSSISQAGYVLIGLQAGSARGTAAVAFYLFTYAFVVIGSFVVVSIVQGPGEARNDLGALRGLSHRRPLLAAAMLVLLLAQAGIPLTSGFLAKFYVIQAAIDRGQYYLAVIGMLAAAVAAFFYLRVALLMYLSPASGSSGASVSPSGASVSPSGAAVSPSGAGSDDGILTAGLQPIAHFDEVPGDGGAVAVLAQPPTTAITVPALDAVVLFVCVAFTIFAGVSGPMVEFAQKATLVF